MFKLLWFFWVCVCAICLTSRVQTIEVSQGRNLGRARCLLTEVWNEVPVYSFDVIEGLLVSLRERRITAEVAGGSIPQ